MDNVVTILSRNFRKINFRIGHIFIKKKKGYSLKKKKKTSRAYAWGDKQYKNWVDNGEKWGGISSKSAGCFGNLNTCNCVEREER